MEQVLRAPVSISRCSIRLALLAAVTLPLTNASRRFCLKASDRAAGSVRDISMYFQESCNVIGSAATNE